MKIYIEKKKKKREVGTVRNRYMNMSEKEKQKLRKSQKFIVTKKKYQLKKKFFLV